MPAQVPHSRMPLVHASSANPEIAQRFGLPARGTRASPASSARCRPQLDHLGHPRDLDAGRRAVLRGRRPELEGVGRAAAQPRARHRHPHRPRPASGARDRVGAAGRRRRRREPRGERLPAPARSRVRPPGHRAAPVVGRPRGGVRALPARARRPARVDRPTAAVVAAGSCARRWSRSSRAARAAATATCNGDAQLCDRSLGDVAFATTHNSMASTAAGFVPPNQRRSMRVAARARDPRASRSTRTSARLGGDRVYTDLVGPAGQGRRAPAGRRRARPSSSIAGWARRRPARRTRSTSATCSASSARCACSTRCRSCARSSTRTRREVLVMVVEDYVPPDAILEVLREARPRVGARPGRPDRAPADPGADDRRRHPPPGLVGERRRRPRPCPTRSPGSWRRRRSRSSARATWNAVVVHAEPGTPKARRCSSSTTGSPPPNR